VTLEACAQDDGEGLKGRGCRSLVANNTFLFVPAKSWISDYLGIVPEASS